MLGASSSRGSFKKFISLGAIYFAFAMPLPATTTPFWTVEMTPYDHQMFRVSPILEMSIAARSGPICLSDVNLWIAHLRDIPYHYSRSWLTPVEVRSVQQGDCKAKAIALYAIMRSQGARHICLVIGKRHTTDTQTHAWLEWQTAVGTFLLDPTFNWTITRPEERSPETYVPFYAYDGAHKYRAQFAPLWPSAGMSAVSQAPKH